MIGIERILSYLRQSTMTERIAAFSQMKIFGRTAQNLFWPYGHLVIIAALIISRRSDALFHPQFWAEDGHTFYHDAYTYGVQTLFWPLGGYFNSLSRLVALISTLIPLVWAPCFFAIVAFLIQMIPPALLLSQRMAIAVPSNLSRLAIAYFYAANPNTTEININLTDAQWHLAMASFLIIVLSENRHGVLRFCELALLTISGLSGPFSIFLAPFAAYEYWSRRSSQSLTNLAIVVGLGAIQLSTIMLGSDTARGSNPLGVSLIRFFEILSNQISLGGLVGDKIMVITIYEIKTYEPLLAVFMAMIFFVIIWFAWVRGPQLFGKAFLFCALMLAAALKAPLVAGQAERWDIMTYPGNGMRYYIMPVMVWFAAILICVGAKSRILRTLSVFFIIITIIGINIEWQYLPYKNTNFTTLAEKFANAPVGQRMEFPENPSYKPDVNFWNMTLIKHDE
jgi:hypothetical protein